MENSELIAAARRVVSPRDLPHDVELGYVGCALVTPKGNVYTGCSAHATCGVGFCAEVCAVAAMIAGGEQEIEMLVAVSVEGSILTPCGRCREMILQLNSRGYDALIVVSAASAVPLGDLLPRHWLRDDGA